MGLFFCLFFKRANRFEEFFILEQFLVYIHESLNYDRSISKGIKILCDSK